MDGRKNWIQGLTLVLCVLLLSLNLWQFRQISDLRGALQSMETNLQMEARRLDERVQAVQQVVNDAEKLVQDWELRSVDVDPASKCLRVEASLQLKEWREDTQVQLAVVQGTDTRQAAMSGGAGLYTGVVDIPVNSREVRLLASVSAGGFRKEEDLSAWDSAFLLLPVQCHGWGAAGPEYTRDAEGNGVLAVQSCNAELAGFEGRTDLPQLSGQAFRLRRNGDIAAEKAAMPGDAMGQYSCGDLSAAAGVGDQYILTFFCWDASGLGYEFYLYGWSIGENGIEDARSPAPKADWPRLSWN